MNRTERIYKIERLLRDRGTVSLDVFLHELEVSKATFKRDLEYLRDRFNAPIVWDREVSAYRLQKISSETKFELPGLWFSAAEVHALLTMQQLLTSLGPGLLTPHITPLLDRLGSILDHSSYSVENLARRIRIQKLNARHYEPEHFPPVAAAVLMRQRLRIEHYNRSKNASTSREISPQRLNHYQENWYLDAWCHLRNDLRRFALDSLQSVRVLPETALDVPEKDIQKALDGGYGIFSGPEQRWAQLMFLNERARWVSKETWHPEQKGHFDEAGNYHLTVPYSDTRELVMDIMRHIPEVQVIAPQDLCEQVQRQLKKGLEQFRTGSSYEPSAL
ncbi:helix-turn-helix transcriptional regulator [Pseudoduganella danionis]|uniref:WYL domain-containing protein n=1 Tax=Pseudoduganella danionis TaxID=1890295 RepID=A0ABW9SRJ1_9BURK|nr:WYL domain-containing protein [Pseudoduganella danionis]MTW32969.1 WYL domain-containing protein [Pseudoduganella danionis]